VSRDSPSLIHITEGSAGPRLHGLFRFTRRPPPASLSLIHCVYARASRREPKRKFLPALTGRRTSGQTSTQGSTLGYSLRLPTGAIESYFERIDAGTATQPKPPPRPPVPTSGKGSTLGYSLGLPTGAIESYFERIDAGTAAQPKPPRRPPVPTSGKGSTLGYSLRLPTGAI